MTKCDSGTLQLDLLLTACRLLCASDTRTPGVVVSLCLTTVADRPSASVVVLIMAAAEETGIRASLAVGAAESVPLMAIPARDIAASGVPSSMARPRATPQF